MVEYNPESFKIGLAAALLSKARAFPQREPGAYPANCLTFASAEQFTVGVNNSYHNWDGTLEYSTDYTDPTSWNAWNGSKPIESAEHGGEQRIYMRGVGNHVITGYNTPYDDRRFVFGGTSNSIRCEGNIENLLDYETVIVGNHPEMGDYSYFYMFEGCAALVKAPQLPAEVLTEGCYYRMFGGCTSLTDAPELRAKAMAQKCYAGMFNSCTSIKSAPKLESTSLAYGCYMNMFESCLGLDEAPALPATNLESYCYSKMFLNCSKLTEAPKLEATTIASNCYNGMFYGCDGLTTVPSLPATTVEYYCYHQMFKNCDNLITLPELPATALAEGCYYRMFEGCKKIKLSKEFAGEYITPYSINATEERLSLSSMFYDTGGIFTGSPELGTTYYLHKDNAIVPANPSYEQRSAVVMEVSNHSNVSLPTGYTQLEYIKSTGTQYIDTEFTPNQDTRIDIVAMPIDNRDVTGDSGVGFAPYGAAESYNKQTFECYSQSTGSGQQFQFGYGGDYFFTGEFVAEQVTTISQNKNRFSVTNAAGTWSGVAYEYTFTAPYTMYLFGTHRPKSIISGAMRIYSCQIYDNGALIRDFVPCKTTAGEIGLWDKVDNEFYGNDGTGTFEAGPQVINHTAMLTGFIIGRAIKHMRGKRDPIGYLYGHIAKEGETPTHTINGVDYVGVFLPKLPDWDKTVYPYAWIAPTWANAAGYTNDYFLTALKRIEYKYEDGEPYLKHDYDFVCYQGDINGWEVHQAEMVVDWMEVGVTAYGYFPAIWSNFDILNEDGTIYLSASEPTPVYE